MLPPLAFPAVSAVLGSRLTVTLLRGPHPTPSRPDRATRAAGAVAPVAPGGGWPSPSAGF